MPNFILENVVFNKPRQRQASCIAFTISRRKLFCFMAVFLYSSTLSSKFFLIVSNTENFDFNNSPVPSTRPPTIKRIKLLKGWVPLHDAKRIVAIIGLPWNGAKVRILGDPGLQPKGRIVWTITKISTEVYFSFLQGWKINSILVGSCTDKVCEQPFHQIDQEVLWQISKSVEDKKLRTYYWDSGKIGVYFHEMRMTSILAFKLVGKM
jgi:hypothetical protein